MSQRSHVKFTKGSEGLKGPEGLDQRVLEWNVSVLVGDCAPPIFFLLARCGPVFIWICNGIGVLTVEQRG